MLLFNLGAHEIVIILLAILFLTGLPIVLVVAAKRMVRKLKGEGGGTEES